MPIVQAGLKHKVLTKQKMVLDKFREVLKLLGVLNQITAHPELSKKLLVAVNEYDATDVLGKISFVNPEALIAWWLISSVISA